MAERKVLVEEKAGRKRVRPLAEDPETGWRWIGWIGFVLLVVGVGDFALVWYPMHLGTPEWEFGTIAASFSGLALIAIGFAGLLGAGLALGSRRLLVAVAVVLGMWSVFLAAAYLLFLTDVPMALGSVEGPAALGVKKAIVKTSLLGVTFTVASAVGAYAAIRHLRGGKGEGS